MMKHKGIWPVLGTLQTGHTTTESYYCNQKNGKLRPSLQTRTILEASLFQVQDLPSFYFFFYLEKTVHI